MFFIIALFIVLFKIIALIFFGYTFYSSKGWGKKSFVFLLFIFYCSLIIPILIISYSNKNNKSDSVFILNIEHQLTEIQKPFNYTLEKTESLLQSIISNRNIAIICVILLFSPIATYNFYHFVLNFIYIMFFCLIWTIFLRSKKESSPKLVSLDNKQGEN